MGQAPSAIPSRTGPRVAHAITETAPLPPGSTERPPLAQTSRGTKPPKRGRTKITNGLVALSSAAILSVYAVGYVQTESADARVGNPVVAQAAVATSPGILPTGTSVVPSPTARSGNTGFFVPNISVATSAAAASTTLPATDAPTMTAPSAIPPTAAPTVQAPTIPPTTFPTATRAATPTSLPTPAPRATATTAAIAAASKYQDGSYTGTGTSRRGDVDVTVVIQGGKITSAAITRCDTAYPCSRIAALPGQVLARQSATVDRVSGATYSTQAYQGAVADALAQAATGTR